MIDRVLENLGALVACDTSDPRRTVTRDHRAIVLAERALASAGCGVQIDDLGEGCVNVLGVRGEPGVMFNVHLDTVAPAPGWTRDPFGLSIEGGRAHGLGACDIKGAAACVLAAVESTDEPIAVLFTTDEEGGRGRCVGHFTGTMPVRPGVVVVGEPTGGRPVLQHRGFASFEIEFLGRAGHTSGAEAASGSAIHRAVRWASGALDLARPGGPLDGARFNIGLIEGGQASNVVASRALVRLGFRPAPGPGWEGRREAAIDALRAVLPEDGSARWSDRFLAPPLTASPAARAACAAWALEPGPDVDFWTEAALFAGAGLPALVLGPGDIAQAHAADEFVEIASLERVADAYARVIRAGLGAETGAVLAS